MDKRTIKKIVDKLLIDERAETRIEGYRYYVEYKPEDDDIYMFPVQESKWFHPELTAYADMRPDNYSYVKGGSIFRKVQEAVWEINESFRKHRAGVE